MKWIRWDGRDNYDTRDNRPTSLTDEDYSDTFTDAELVCAKDKNWREIESGTLNLEDGKLHITLKPLPEPEKVPTLLEALVPYLSIMWGNAYLRAMRGSAQYYVVALAEAVEREEKKSPNPYTKEAVDELLNALGREWPESSDSDFCKWNPGYRGIGNGIKALLRQREAANVT